MAIIASVGFIVTSCSYRSQWCYRETEYDNKTSSAVYCKWFYIKWFYIKWFYINWWITAADRVVQLFSETRTTLVCVEGEVVQLKCTFK